MDRFNLLNSYSKCLKNFHLVADGKLFFSTGRNPYNPFAKSVARGFPRSHTPKRRESGYSISRDYIISPHSIDENGNIHKHGECVCKPGLMGYALFGFDNDNIIWGKEIHLYSCFFMIGDKLYEVEMHDNVMVSNYVEYELY